jgi:hypothetical protein
MAKMNAATRPASGTWRSSRVSAAFFTETAINPAATTPPANESGAFMKPSGMCTGSSWALCLRLIAPDDFVAGDYRSFGTRPPPDGSHGTRSSGDLGTAGS